MTIHIQSEPSLVTRFSHILDKPSRNVSDLISVVRVAANAVDEATNILQRMRDLALQASNVNRFWRKQQLWFWRKRDSRRLPFLAYYSE